jgi:hypothetical protein
MVTFHTQTPIEATMSASEWLRYQTDMLAPNGAMEDEQEANAVYITAALRLAIAKGRFMSDKAKRQYASDQARAGLDQLFSVDLANKAKLRWRKYKPSFNIAHLRNEVAFFIAHGQPLQHTRHLTQDTDLPAKEVA